MDASVRGLYRYQEGDCPRPGAIGAGATALFAASGTRITGAMSLLVEKARASGDIRADTDGEDLLRALIGFTYGNTGRGWEASARRLIGILMDGLRPVNLAD